MKIQKKNKIIRMMFISCFLIGFFIMGGTILLNFKNNAMSLIPGNVNIKTELSFDFSNFNDDNFG